MSNPLINELGNKYGALTPIELTKDKNGRTAWLCQCDCGNTKVVRGPDLRNGRITTCGAGCPCKTARHGTYIDETGNRYGKLTVMYRVPNNPPNVIKWHCKCDCGNECDVRVKDLRNGRTQSCGCLRSQKELEIKNILSNLNIDFQREYTFKDLYYKAKSCPLRFDFALFNNNKLIGLIEYQGNQHKYPVRKFGGYEELQYRQKRDELKREYCKNHNIPILYLYPDSLIEDQIKLFIGDKI